MKTYLKPRAKHLNAVLMSCKSKKHDSKIHMSRAKENCKLNKELKQYLKF